MKEPSITLRIGVAAGFCISFGATFWLLSFESDSSSMASRIGFASAFVCCFGTLIFSWASAYAYLVRKQNWSYRACRYAGLAFMAPASLLFLAHPRTSTITEFVILQAALTSYFCRRIAFPALSDEDAAALPPLPTMFPK
jgi:hypothetical protein